MDRQLIYRIGTAEFRKRCQAAMMSASKLPEIEGALKVSNTKLAGVDAGFADQGISTEGWTEEDYRKGINDLAAKKSEV